MEQDGAQSEKWTDGLSPAQVGYLAALVETGMVTRACEAAKVGRATVHRWRHTDERFQAALVIAQELAVENAEDEAVRRAVHGLRKYKFTKDGTAIKHPETNQFYFEHEYSDNLLMFVLKAMKPEKYKDRVHNEHSGQVEYVKHVILEDRPSGNGDKDAEAEQAGQG